MAGLQTVVIFNLISGSTVTDNTNTQFLIDTWELEKAKYMYCDITLLGVECTNKIRADHHLSF